MFTTLKNAWKIEELKKKMLFTIFIILLYRIGTAIPVPYINTDLLEQYFQSASNTLLGLYNVMSGSAFSQATIFALGVQPYINASIIIQLLGIAIPSLEELSHQGEEGKKKLNRITRYSTIAIALLQGLAFFLLMKNNGMLLIEGSTIWAGLVIVATFTAGSSLVMWLAEQITAFGISNGISIILFVGIVSRIPTAIYTSVVSIIAAPSTFWIYLLMLIGALAMIVLIVFITNAERRIPIMYSKRVVGRKVYGGSSTHLPLKVNMSGVLPIIFAQTIASIPATIGTFLGKTAQSGGFWGGLLSVFDTGKIFYAIIYFLLIIFFSYFYSTIQFNPIEVSNNLRKNGGYIPGFRPGKPTSDFILRVLKKITMFGALYLSIVAITPLIVGMVSETAASANIAIGGTSLIIVIGVALDTVRGLEAQMLMRNYKGFLE